uniref:Dehydrogenase/reductase SDR family member 7B n=1 Tax=Myotis myotis TaxID=51298 RepID=A0A7J7RDS3_MYOMY|nr:dehydrogenase/reductase 7B [Myotis myotis]
MARRFCFQLSTLKLLRKSSLTVRAMDCVTSTAVLSLLLGCVGVFSLFKLLRCLRMKARLQDAVVVITGATSGLGRECAKVFHAVGAKLVLCGRNREALGQLAKELAASRASEVSPRARLLGRRVRLSSAEIVAPGLLDVVPVQVAAGCHSSCSAAGQGRAAMVRPTTAC